MRNIGNRHRGTLGGRFTDTRIPARVVIAIAAEFAPIPAMQHLAWMLVNLLARQPDEIGPIVLDIPSDVAAIPALTPLAGEGGDLTDSLREGAVRINPDIFTRDADSGTRDADSGTCVFIRIGPGPLATADLALATTATGWGGYVGRVHAPSTRMDANPVGAYVAASLCVGEVFKFVRAMDPEAGEYAERVWLDAYELAVSSEPPTYHALPDDITLAPAVLAGVGAVANGLLHTLYPLTRMSGDLVLIDHDPEGVTDTNLNRYVLFGIPQIGQPKANAAARCFAGRSLAVAGEDESWQDWRVGHPNLPLNLVLSAVDKNSARHAIQDALPRVILGASTHEMRAQVDCYDPLGGGACLRCHNPIEAATPDADIIARLRTMEPTERAMQAHALDIGGDDLDTFLRDPVKHCGMISGATIQRFAATTAQAEWSVGFVSTLAGVLLAGEYIKRSLGRPVLNVAHSTFRFQFWRSEHTGANRIVGTPPAAGCTCRGRIFRRAMEIKYQPRDHDAR